VPCTLGSIVIITFSGSRDRAYDLANVGVDKIERTSPDWPVVPEQSPHGGATTGAVCDAALFKGTLPATIDSRILPLTAARQPAAHSAFQGLQNRARRQLARSQH